MNYLSEPMPELFKRSKLLILDFSKINKTTPTTENILHFFTSCKLKGINPRQPENRQLFNNKMLKSSEARYLIGIYGEDRSAMLKDTLAGKEGRTIHMAIDIFSKGLEQVFSPCSGIIIRSDYEKGFGEYGNYIIIKPNNADFYVFLGHLANNRKDTGIVKRGEVYPS